MTWPELLAALAQPFPASAIYWRPGNVSRDKKRAQALPYAEPRVYEDALNRLVPGEWSCTFKPWGESRLICELTIRDMTRSSTGEFSREDFAPGTSAEAQAFKRACVKFGLGRYLYDLPSVWCDYDERTRKLTETPTIPEKFLPKPEVATSLDKKRAAEMHRELGRLGLINHYQFASEVLSIQVSSFEGLREVDALEVWNAAKREASMGGSPWIKEREQKAA